MKLYHIIIAMLIHCCCLLLTADDEVVKQWDRWPDDDIAVGLSPGNRARLNMCPQVKTPSGAVSMEFSLDQVNSANAQLHHIQLLMLYKGAPLEANCEYEIEFQVKATSPGALIAVAAQGGPPWREIPNRKKVSLTDQWQPVKMKFKLPQDALPPLHLPRIMFENCPSGTKVYLSPVVLRRVPQVVSIDLNPIWNVFTGVELRQSMLGINAVELYQTIPGEISGIRPVQTELRQQTIDLAKLSPKFKTGDCAILYNEFESKQSGIAHLGFSADWWMEIYVNGQKVYDTLLHGNRAKNYQPDDHVIAFPIKAGANLLAVKILAGSEGWRLVCGRPTRTPVNINGSVTLRQNDDWRRLSVPPQVEAGSILDFSTLGMLDAPAGKHGRVIVRNGHFAFADHPDKPQRFYGTNLYMKLCFPDKEHARKLADIIAAYGYNAVRLHHFDFALVEDAGSNWTKINPEQLDRLNYLVKCFKDKGIYISIDLDTLRATRQLKEKDKISIIFKPEIRKNWELFAQNLLNSVNPYTGISWKEEPAMIGICPVNENAPLFFLSCLGTWPAGCDAEFEHWKQQNKLSARTAAETKELATKFAVESSQITDAQLCDFLRNQGVMAPLTYQNVGSMVAMALIREHCDYVDNHFYWNHPTFSPGGNLPAGVEGGSAIREYIGSRGHLPDVFAARLTGKPYAITEFNFCTPNPYRAEGGALAGAYAALQDWDALFRFGYAEAPVQIDHDWPTVWFDTAGDPMKSLSDQLAILLFLRRDVQSADLELAIEVPRNYPDTTGIWQQTTLGGLYPPELSNWGFVGKIGSVIVDRNGEKSPFSAATADSDHIIRQKLNARFPAVRGNLDMAQKYAKSCTGELELDGKKGTFVISTANTEAIAAVEGGKFTAGRLTAGIKKDFALISVSSLDRREIGNSRKMLVFHLTNVLNDEMRFSDDSLLTVEAYGIVPHLVRRGVADVTLKLEPGTEPTVYAVDLSGRRLEKIPSTFSSDGTLSFTADTFQLKTPCMVYEIERP